MMKHMQQTSVKVRREFDETFKRESVQHWVQSGKSAQVIAHELGLQASRLYAWKQQGFAPAAAGRGAAAGAKPGSLADVQGQLGAALREIGHLREQRDILKKTLGILSEPPLNALNGSTR
jgi:transposase-like protein